MMTSGPSKVWRVRESAAEPVAGVIIALTVDRAVQAGPAGLISHRGSLGVGGRAGYPLTLMRVYAANWDRVAPSTPFEV